MTVRRRIHPVPQSKTRYFPPLPSGFAGGCASGGFGRGAAAFGPPLAFEGDGELADEKFLDA